MVDFTGIELGRQVATPDQVFSVIRAELRIAHVYGAAMIDSCRNNRLYADPDFNLLDGGDKAADLSVWEALVESAMQNVKEWAGDEGVVYDREKLKGFIEMQLRNALSGLIEWGEIDY